MNDLELAVVEFVLTAAAYSEDTRLDRDDLPPDYRQVFWGDGRIERPLNATDENAAEATGVDDPWSVVSGLMFTDRDDFTETIAFSDREMAEEWYLDRADVDRLGDNPVLARYFEGDVDGVDYAAARAANRPSRVDRAHVDSLLEEYFVEDEEEEMLDLVDVRTPDEVDMTLDDIVLTGEQEGEIQKLVKAIEHREYLASIGLREIGKLLFVGPPGTGKTSVARALGQKLDLPVVEVKLSMITSQYLGETAKNVEKTFEVAKRLAPCILFIDEFDFVAKTRASDEHAAIKRAVNTLLKSIDEVSLVQDEVLLIGATNHPDQLDAAAWRRFDEIVNFPKPDRGMRSEILQVVTREMDIADFEPAEIADITEGLTGSDLRLVLREAVLDALTEERMTLTQTDLREAVADFEERDTLKNLDMIEADHDALVAGGSDFSEEGGEGSGDGGAGGHEDEGAEAPPAPGATDGGESGHGHAHDHDHD
jgi:ATP-dependent 26S proteasome regulatory subunit